ncbi:MAG: DUF1643 domain-containing protein [Acidimicrobiales bacterium]|nr:DUF1643 domain-containing protein [Acidimicrobiales bacterium]
MPGDPCSDLSTWGSEGGSYSFDGQYRWSFERTIGHHRRTICWIGLYPTTLDTGGGNRRTLQRMCRFSQELGMGRLLLVNLFSLRCGDLAELRAAAAHDMERAVGAETNARIIDAAHRSDRIIASWGNHGDIGARSRALLEVLPSQQRKRLQCLGVTASGEPRQPGRLPNPLQLVPFELSRS